MATLEFPSTLIARETGHWRLRTSTFTPGRALDGRQQFIGVENRTWEVAYHVSNAWDGLTGTYLAFIDQVRGATTSFLVPVANAWTTTYGGDPAAFWTSVGISATEISDGFIRWSDGTTFSDGTGWALPDHGDPVVLFPAPAGSSRIRLHGYLGRNLAVGAYFAVNNFLYRVQSNTDGDIRFNPPLREAVVVGDVAVVNAPKARVRFGSDEDYMAALDIGQYYAPFKLAFVEAFDR